MEYKYQINSRLSGGDGIKYNGAYKTLYDAEEAVKMFKKANPHYEVWIVDTTTGRKID